MGRRPFGKYTWLLAICLGFYWVPFYLTLSIWGVSETVAQAIDSLGQFRMYFLAFFLLASTVFAVYGRRLLAVSGFLGSMVECIFLTSYFLQNFKAPAVTSEMTHKIKVYQHNIRYDNKKIADFISYVQIEKPDVLLLQEVSSPNEKQMEILKEIYPTFETCSFMPVIGKVAVISRFSMIEGSKSCEEGHINIKVRAFDGQIINLSSIHLYWPFPFSQMEQVMGFVSKFPKDHLILGGDFNSVPWGLSLAKIREHTGAIHTPGLRITLRRSFHKSLGLLYLPIDHVLSTAEFVPTGVEVGSSYGSDHVSTTVEFLYRRK